MDIVTGYFAKAMQYAAMGYALVSIARRAPWFLPKDIVLNSIIELAPPEEILALKDSPSEYEPRYQKEVLDKLNPWTIYQQLYTIAHRENTDKVVLLCYEAPGKFCHRHIVAKWLGESLGREIEECSIMHSPSTTLFDSDV